MRRKEISVLLLTQIVPFHILVALHVRRLRGSNLIVRNTLRFYILLDQVYCELEDALYQCKRRRRHCVPYVGVLLKIQGW
jgi:hypothetical protein